MSAVRQRAISGAAIRLRTGQLRGSTIGNALALFGTTIVTSGWGFAFWFVAAHEFSPRAVGSSSAVLAALQLLATTAMLGLGTFLIGELAAGSTQVAALLSTAGLTSALAGTGFGMVFALVASEVAPRSFGMLGSLSGFVAFSVLVGLTAALLVIDSATVGLSRSSWQFWRNVTYSVLKVALLPIAAWILGSASARAPVYAWLVGTVLSVPPLLLLARRAKLRWLAHPRWALVRVHGAAALAHHWLNVAVTAPRLLLPIFVAALLGPALNASFYIAVLLAGFASIVPTHLSTALFAVASGDRPALARELRRTLAISAATSVASILVFGLAATFLLSLFGSHYRSGTDALMVLGLAAAPTTVRSHYIAVCRVNGDLRRCAVISVAGCLLELALPLAGLLAASSITVAAACWVAALTFQAILTWPVVAAAGSLPGRLSPKRSRYAAWLAPRTLERGT